MVGASLPNKRPMNAEVFMHKDVAQAYNVRPRN